MILKVIKSGFTPQTISGILVNCPFLLSYVYLMSASLEMRFRQKSRTQPPRRDRKQRNPTQPPVLVCAPLREDKLAHIPGLVSVNSEVSRVTWRNGLNHDSY